MDREYLIGELSVRLERLQATTAQHARGDLVQLRNQVETGTPRGLASAMASAVSLADDLCWQSLSEGDTATFARQAAAGADLRLFGISAHLLTDE